MESLKCSLSFNFFVCVKYIYKKNVLQICYRDVNEAFKSLHVCEGMRKNFKMSFAIYLEIFKNLRGWGNKSMQHIDKRVIIAAFAQ